MTAPGENLLRHELSPYLLQHADNPVHWRPWGAVALAEAQARHCPILLSVGYAACHWCHVMAHESFEDPATAAEMNRLFVCIKVDREERPEIDHLYMSALHAMGEQGGWPLTMFLAPDGQPFWGGTYFPPEPRWGRPSFRQVLAAMAEAWATQPDAIAKNRAGMQRALAAMSAARPGAMPTPQTLEAVAGGLLAMVDREQGGLRGAPKFPNPPIFRFLWQHARCRGDAPAAEQAVHHLLRAMSQGGIYDHLGGGYARYSTDAEWLAPHFEKMLYDNAQILELLALAHAAEPDELYRARAEETVGWLVRDMTAQADPNGHAAFAAAEDADSEGEEGKFYVWSQGEVAEVLGDAAAPFCAAYDVTPHGNWEGKTILRRITPPGDASAEAALSEARAALLRRRGQRIRPSRDDKVLADWNGLAIAALCRAAAVFQRPDWLHLAQRAFGFLTGTMQAEDGRMQHAWRLGRITAAGLLEDQAHVARAALALFEATGAPPYLDIAVTLAEAAVTWFSDSDGSFFASAADATDVPGRVRTAGDNATPSGNGVMAEVLARLFHLTGTPRWRQLAEAVLTAFGGAGQGLSGMPTLLAAAELLEDATVVVVTGPTGDATAAALRQTACAAANPATVVLRVTDTAVLPVDHPAHGKPAGLSLAYFCRGSVCGLPLAEPAALAELLRRTAVDS